MGFCRRAAALARLDLLQQLAHAADGEPDFIVARLASNRISREKRKLSAK
jgi:hypothetical protein